MFANFNKQSQKSLKRVDQPVPGAGLLYYSFDAFCDSRGPGTGEEKIILLVGK
jgi:hypothetical protein